MPTLIEASPPRCPSPLSLRMLLECPETVDSVLDSPEIIDIEDSEGAFLSTQVAILQTPPRASTAIRYTPRRATPRTPSVTPALLSMEDLRHYLPRSPPRLVRQDRARRMMESPPGDAPPSPTSVFDIEHMRRRLPHTFACTYCSTQTPSDQCAMCQHCSAALCITCYNNLRDEYPHMFITS